MNLYFEKLTLWGLTIFLMRNKISFSTPRNYNTVFYIDISSIAERFLPIISKIFNQKISRLHFKMTDIKDSKGEEHGKITKKWSGLFKEAFSDADNFGVTWPAQWDAKFKSLMLGAVFLIDFIHFEKAHDIITIQGGEHVSDCESDVINFS